MEILCELVPQFYERCEGGFWVGGQACPRGGIFWNAIECCVLAHRFPCRDNCLAEEDTRHVY